MLPSCSPMLSTRAPLRPGIGRSLHHRAQNQRGRVRAASTSVCIDLGCVVDLTKLTISAGLEAARKLWPERVFSEDVAWFQEKAEKGRLMALLSSPEDVVHICRLLQDELLDGKREREEGRRRTRPFRLAEISELWSDSDGDLVNVCLLRWALEKGVSKEQLKSEARELYQQALKSLADSAVLVQQQGQGQQQQPAPSATAQALMERARGASSMPQQQQQPQQPQQSPGLQGEEPWEGLRTYTPIAEAIKAAVQAGGTQASSSAEGGLLSQAHSVALVSLLPPPLTAHVLASCGLAEHTSRGQGAEGEQQVTSSAGPGQAAGAASDPRASLEALFRSGGGKDKPGLLVVHAADWEQGVQEALQQLQVPARADARPQQGGARTGGPGSSQVQPAEPVVVRAWTLGSAPGSSIAAQPEAGSNSSMRMSPGMQQGQAGALCSSEAGVSNASGSGAAANQAGPSSTSKNSTTHIISGNLARLEQLGPLDSCKLHLSEWGPSSMSLRARALCNPGVKLLDERGLAELMGCGDLRVVMDGIAW